MFLPCTHCGDVDGLPDCCEGRAADNLRRTGLLEEFECRVEEEGIASAEVSDGRVLMFTVPVLRRLLADAESNPDGRAVVFIRTPSAASS